MWKVSWFYEKVHNIANFGGYAAILLLEILYIKHSLSMLEKNSVPIDRQHLKLMMI